jgi:hypothetical protein
MAALDIKRAQFHGEWNYHLTECPSIKLRVYFLTRP